jgi:hypothetical protein
MAKTDKIIVFIGDQQIELTGADKDSFLAQKEIDVAEEAKLQIAKDAKAAQRLALFDRLGITAEEAKLLLA